jgi:beta-mannanase
MEEGFVRQNTACDWRGRSLTDLEAEASRHGRWLLATVEPWDTTLSGIIAGKYDADLARLADQLSRSASPVIIRWGHECEIDHNGYPWSGKAPSDYIAAYRHVADYLRGRCSQKLYFLWSPIGNANCGAYFPGAAYVDFTGCSLYSWNKVNQKFYQTNDGSFKNLFGAKYGLLSEFGKEIIIAECGIEKSDDQCAWVRAMHQAVDSFPLLHAVVYFDAHDSFEWYAGSGKPDWRIASNLW